MADIQSISFTNQIFVYSQVTWADQEDKLQNGLLKVKLVRLQPSLQLATARLSSTCILLSKAEDRE